MTAEVLSRSPLGGRDAALERVGAREVAFLAQVSVRFRPETGAERLPLPTEPNTWAASNGGEFLWLGPDEWLVVGDPGTERDTIAWIEDELGTAHRSVVDVSSNRAVIDLVRPDRFDLLEQGCGIDLHPRSWRSGMCAQTLLARVPVILQERGDATRVFVRPSYAEWLLEWLLAVAG